MANKEYIDRLQVAVQHMHKCAATHASSVPIHEMFQGQTVWQGTVEVFDLAGHPQAKRCYAWSENQSKPDEHFTAVLEIPPVNDAQSAVRASIVSQFQKGIK